MAFMPPTEEDKSKKDILFEKLKYGIQDVLESEKFKQWCETSSKLYANNYSLKNSILTYTQKPNASYVMGYEAWKAFGRQVKAGAKSIEIFIPSFAREYEKDGLFKHIKRSMTEQLNTGAPLASYQLGSSKITFTMQKNRMLGLKIDGREVKLFMSEDECKKFIERNIIGKVPIGYSVGHVFDVSDTSVPEHLWLKKGFKESEKVYDDDGYPVRNKKGEYKVVNSPERQGKFIASMDTTIPDNDTEKMKILFSVLQKVSENNGVPLTVEEIEDKDTKGFFQRGDSSRIVISDKLSSYSEMCAVAFHEIGHSIMHKDLNKLKDELEQEIDASVREVQAEAVAYMAASKFGIDTDISNFTYIANWSKGKELKDLEKSLDIIYRTGKSMVNDIEKELLSRGLNLSLEPIPKEPLANEEKAAICKEFASFALEKNRYYSDVIKDITTALSPAVTKNSEERDVTLKQSKIVKNIHICISVISDLTEKLQSTDHREEQDSIVDKLNVLVGRVGQYEDNFDMLTEYKIDLIKQELEESDLTRQYSKKPLAILEELRDEYPVMEKLTRNDLKYLSTSKFISSEYSSLLNTDPKQFVDRALEQLKKAKKVQSKNGTFVEISFCEQWGETPIFERGTVAHPIIANSIIKQAESQIRNFKEIAEKQEEYYPYSKCDLTIYTVNKDGEMTGIATRIDIGDGGQTELIDHMESVCKRGAKKIEILNNIKDSLYDQRVKSKILTPSPIIMIAREDKKSQKTDKSQEAEIRPKPQTKSVDAWKNEINILRDEKAESENNQVKPNEHSKQYNANNEQRGKP